MTWLKMLVISSSFAWSIVAVMFYLRLRSLHAKIDALSAKVAQIAGAEKNANRSLGV